MEDYLIINGHKLEGKTLEIYRNLKSCSKKPVKAGGCCGGSKPTQQTITPCNCNARKPQENEIIINHGGMGIGDAILGLYAVKSLKLDNPGKKIIYMISDKARPIIELFDGYDQLERNMYDRVKEMKNDHLQLNNGYDLECQVSGIRWIRYQKNIGASGCVQPQLKKYNPIPEYDGCVILSPYSCNKNRMISLNCWVEIQKQLTDSGERVIVISDNPISESFACEKLINIPPEKLVGMILSSTCLIGLDSGMSHLSGCLGKRTIVLSWDRRDITHIRDIFGLYKYIDYINKANPDDIKCSDVIERFNERRF